MRVFIYEELCGGGLYPEYDHRDGTFPQTMAEGAAMVAALTADFSNLPGIEVVGLRDSLIFDLPTQLSGFVPVASFRERREFFDDLASSADAAILIAPETDDCLFDRARRVEELGTPLWSPPSDFITWASDKHRTCETLSSGGVPTPRGVLLRSTDPWPSEFPLPAVLKPNGSCGGDGNSVRRDPSPPEPERRRATMRLEQFVSGVHASVGVLRGSAGAFPLPPCAQDIRTSHALGEHLWYHGGSCPLRSPYAERAEMLARRAAAIMPPWIGYVGIDMVLGEQVDGSQDYVIEVNPRLTTSYVGTSALADANLAQAMLDVAAGRRPKLSFRGGWVEFTPEGVYRSEP